MTSLTELYRSQWAAVFAATVRLTRDFGAAEDAVQDAFAAALATWPVSGVPPNPGGWLTTTAKRKALDRMRRSAALTRKLPLLVVPDGDDPEPIGDQRLRLVFTCCHPALAQHARVALTLRLVCGLATADIARLFLVPEATMAARITTAKKKIREAGIPYRTPTDLPARLPAVLAVVYLVHTAGSPEALPLASLLAELLPAEPEVLGLLALIRLGVARSAARVAGGRPVPLAAQDRSLWDRAAIGAALPLVRRALAGSGPYALQAAIAALHASAASYADTDWVRILALYDELLVVQPSPTVALSRAVALAEVHGPAAALAEADALAGALKTYYLLPAARAEFLRALGRHDEASAEDLRAAELAPTEGESEFFRARAVR